MSARPKSGPSRVTHGARCAESRCSLIMIPFAIMTRQQQHHDSRPARRCRRITSIMIIMISVPMRKWLEGKEGRSANAPSSAQLSGSWLEPWRPPSKLEPSLTVPWPSDQPEQKLERVDHSYTATIRVNLGMPRSGDILLQLKKKLNKEI